MPMCWTGYNSPNHVSFQSISLMAFWVTYTFYFSPFLKQTLKVAKALPPTPHHEKNKPYLYPVSIFLHLFSFFSFLNEMDMFPTSFSSLTQMTGGTCSAQLNLPACGTVETLAARLSLGDDFLWPIALASLEPQRRCYEKNGKKGKKKKKKVSPVESSQHDAVQKQGSLLATWGGPLVVRGPYAPA